MLNRIRNSWRGTRSKTDETRNATTSEALWRALFGVRPSKSGQVVTWETALQVTTLLRGVNVIADGVATIPLKVYRSDDAGGRTEDKTHPLYRVFSSRANANQTGIDYRTTMMAHLLLCANHFAFRNVVAGELVELIPFQPGQVTTKVVGDKVTYRARGLDGRDVPIPAESMWHVRGLSWDGAVGMAPVRLAREAIGLSLATEEHHARLHANGAKPGGLYSVEGELDGEQYKALKAWVTENTTGDNAMSPMILDRGATFTATGMTGVDAQHMETRGHQIEEACRIIGVLPIMVGHSDKTATYASAEQMFIAHAVHTLRPWHRRIEAAISADLLTDADRREGVYVKFIDTELMRGAAKDRAEYYAKALGSGNGPAWLTQDEVRGFEDLEPLGGAAAELPKQVTPTPTPGVPQA